MGYFCVRCIHSCIFILWSCKQIFESYQENFQSISNWFEQKFPQIFESCQENLQPVLNWFEQKFQQILSLAKKISNQFQTGSNINSILNQFPKLLPKYPMDLSCLLPMWLRNKWRNQKNAWLKVKHNEWMEICVLIMHWFGIQ